MQVNDANRKRRGIWILGLVCLFLQLGLAPYIGLGNGRINFALVYAAIFSLAVGGQAGVLCGFFAGLVFDLSSTGPIGLMALLLTVMAAVLGIEERNRMVDGFPSTLSAFGLASFVVIFVYHLMMLFVGDATSLADVVLMRTLPTFALTFVAFMPFAYFLCRSAEGSSGNGLRRSRRGGHFDIRGL